MPKDGTFLHEISLFQNLNEDQTALILELMNEKTFKAKQVIISEGIAGDSLYIITSGDVRVYRTFDQEQFQLTVLHPHDFFGEMSLIDDFAASATVEAITDTEVLEMKRADFKALTSSNTEVSARLWESLARSLNMKIRKTGDLVKMYYGLNKALCQDEQFRELYTSWNFHMK